MPFVTVHQIESTGSNKQRKVTAAGKPYKPQDEKERDYLLRVGAIREVAQKDVAAAQPADDPNVEIESMTKVELIKFAKDNGIEIDESATKAVILEAIANHAEDDLL